MATTSAPRARGEGVGVDVDGGGGSGGSSKALNASSVIGSNDEASGMGRGALEARAEDRGEGVGEENLSGR